MFTRDSVTGGLQYGSASGSTYTTIAGDRGANISVQASYTDGGGNSEQVSSIATPSILPQVLTDDNFHFAIDQWFINETYATAAYGHISDWNTSAVTNMSKAFQDRTSFNEDIGDWDTSNVTDMSNMFQRANIFNQDIGDWNTSSLVGLSWTFASCTNFNQDIGNWDTSNVIGMSNTFRNTPFNQDIGDWNVSSVNNMNEMFYSAHEFNQDIGNWDTSNLSKLTGTFHMAHAFDQDIGGWDVSNVTDMNRTFRYALSFNQDISDWNISSANNMPAMFGNTPALSNTNKGLIHESFSSNSNWSYDWREFVALDNPNFQTAVNLWFDNQAEANATYGHISDWNTSAVTDMTDAFLNRTSFNEDIGNWDVSM